MQMNSWSLNLFQMKTKSISMQWTEMKLNVLPFVCHNQSQPQGKTVQAFNECDEND